MATSDWNPSTLEARIQDASKRHRYAGGSPDNTEIAAYAAALPSYPREGIAVVLGMTPELRRLALRRYPAVVAIDINPQAIALYRDWIDPPDRRRESIVRADWMTVGRLFERPAQVVLGDGVFGNLPNLDAHRKLLRQIAWILAPEGGFVTRKALIPAGFDPTAHRAEALLTRYRRGEIDEAEFGFGTRLVGHYEQCYDSKTFLLDNGEIFRRCEEAHRRGELTETEYRVILRYYFGGKNCIVPQTRWEELLKECGYEFAVFRCRGKTWYDYYVVYLCIPRADAASAQAHFAAPRGYP